MADEEVETLAVALYDSQLREVLERDHFGEFAAIEPISGDHYLGKTSLDAALAARRAWPERISLVIRIGYAVAHDLGSWQR